MEDFTNVSFGGKFSMVDFVGGLQADVSILLGQDEGEATISG